MFRISWKNINEKKKLSYSNSSYYVRFDNPYIAVLNYYLQRV